MNELYSVHSYGRLWQHDGKSIIKISNKGFSSQDYSKTKTMYVIPFTGNFFRGLPKHLLDYTLPLGPRDYMTHGTGLPLPQIFSFFSYGPYSSTYPGQSLIVLAVRKQK